MSAKLWGALCLDHGLTLIHFKTTWLFKMTVLTVAKLFMQSPHFQQIIYRFVCLKELLQSFEPRLSDWANWAHVSHSHSAIWTAKRLQLNKQVVVICTQQMIHIVKKKNMLLSCCAWVLMRKYCVCMCLHGFLCSEMKRTQLGSYFWSTVGEWGTMGWTLTQQ